MRLAPARFKAQVHFDLPRAPASRLNANDQVVPSRSIDHAVLIFVVEDYQIGVLLPGGIAQQDVPLKPRAHSLRGNQREADEHSQNSANHATLPPNTPMIQNRVHGQIPRDPRRLFDHAIDQFRTEDGGLRTEC